MLARKQKCWLKTAIQKKNSFSSPFKKKYGLRKNYQYNKHKNETKMKQRTVSKDNATKIKKGTRSLISMR